MLKLPTDAIGTGSQIDVFPGCWPQRLEHLQLSLGSCIYMTWWDKMFESWPPTLQILTIAACSSYALFDSFEHLILSSTTIKHLQIGHLSSIVGEEDGLPIHHIISRFPNTQILSIPASLRYDEKWQHLDVVADDHTLDNLSGGFAHIEKESQVEILTLTRQLDPLYDPFKGHGPDAVKALARKFPLVREIYLPESLIHSDEIEEYENIASELHARSAHHEGTYNAGIYYIEDLGIGFQPVR